MFLCAYFTIRVTGVCLETELFSSQQLPRIIYFKCNHWLVLIFRIGVDCHKHEYNDLLKVNIEIREDNKLSKALATAGEFK